MDLKPVTEIRIRNLKRFQVMHVTQLEVSQKYEGTTGHVFELKCNDQVFKALAANSSTECQKWVYSIS